MSRILLLDADIIVHRMAHVNQYTMKWDDDTYSYYSDFGHAKAQFTGWVTELQDRLWADDTRLYLSDSESNWRHGLLPNYKGHRASWQEVKLEEPNALPPAPGPQRPLLYKPLREWLVAEHGAVVVPSLEADDLLGLIATDPIFPYEEPVIVTVDKDLLTVPGKHFNPDKPGAKVIDVDAATAQYNHFMLVLCGDTADGYKGCPGVGPVKAAAMLARECSWDTVVAAYVKAGLTEEDALVQARVARVLQWGDYDFDTKEVTLWVPK